MACVKYDEIDCLHFKYEPSTAFVPNQDLARFGKTRFNKIWNKKCSNIGFFSKSRKTNKLLEPRCLAVKKSEQINTNYC